MKTVRKPTFRLVYTGVDITTDISDRCISLSYRDRHHGMADEVEVTLSDADGLWRDRIVPRGGERFAVAIGYEGEKLLDCGNFEVDEPEYGHERIILRGISTAVKSSLQRHRSLHYTETTLSGIVQTIAKRNGLKVKGKMAAISFMTLNQNESDLAFLNNLAERYGFIIKVYTDTLVMMPYEEIERQEPVATLTLSDLLDDWRIVLNENKRYRECEVRYDRKGFLFTATAVDKSIESDRVLIESDRCETASQAKARAKALLAAANREFVSGSFSTAGNILLCAGNNVRLSGLGALSGIYHIKESSHQIAETYVTHCEVYRVSA